MAISIANDTAARGTPAKTPNGAKPDVEKIMGDIRRVARERAEEGTRTEREFKADVKKRMLLPLGSRGFSDDFAEQIRSRDSSRWNVQLTAAQFHGSAFVLMRMLRWFFKPLARLLVNVHPAVQQAARQAEINEYHRRLLWTTNRDLELARLEINLIKTELRRLGVNAEFSFSPGPSGAEAPARSSGSGRGRSDARGRSDRGRGERRRSNGGRSDRESAGRRERQGSGQGSRQSGGQPTRQNARQGGRPNRGGRRAGNGGATGDK